MTTRKRPLPRRPRRKAVPVAVRTRKPDRASVTETDGAAQLNAQFGRVKDLLLPGLRAPELHFTWIQSSMTTKSLVWELCVSDGSRLIGESPAELLTQLARQLENEHEKNNSWAPTVRPVPRRTLAEQAEDQRRFIQSLPPELRPGSGSGL